MCLWSDLKFTFRLLVKNIRFNLFSALVISLGVGIALPVLQLNNNFLYALLPFSDGVNYVVIVAVDNSARSPSKGARSTDGIDTHIYSLIIRRSTSLELVGAAKIAHSSIISDGESPKTVSSAVISPNLLQRTGVNPILGRSLARTDSIASAEPVVLLSYKIWQEYYGANEDVLSQRSRVDGRSHAIVGVMPEGFGFPISHELWLPMQELGSATRPSEDFVTPIGVLKKGVSLESANAEIQILLANLKEDFPLDYASVDVRVMPYTRIILPNDTPVFTIMLSFMVVIFLLACLNVGNLLLVRATERRQEIVIRRALGASRWRIAVHVLIESFFICLLGALLGIVVAFYSIQYITQIMSIIELPFWMDFSLNGRAIGWAMIISVIIWLLAGGLPAWRISGLDIDEGLKGSGKALVGKSSNRLTGFLVSVEVVLSVFSLSASATLVVTLNGLQDADYGTATKEYLTAQFDLSGESYGNQTKRLQFYQDFQRDIMAQSGVWFGALTTALPGVVPAQIAPYNLEDRNLREDNTFPRQPLVAISDNYFDVMEVTLVAGRFFAFSDALETEAVIIVDEIFVNRMWPSESALGRRIQLYPNDALKQKWLKVVGVVTHIVQSPAFIPRQQQASFYLPISQATPLALQLVLKVEGDPNQYRSILENTVKKIDRDIPLNEVYSLVELQQRMIGPLGLMSSIFTSVAIVTLVLAATGIYGLISRSVLQRTQEVGIRRALGQTNASVIWLFLRQGGYHLLIGLVLGGSAGLAANFGASKLYPEVLDYALIILFAVAITMTLLIMGASWLPAQQTTSIEPSEALRYE